MPEDLEDDTDDQPEERSDNADIRALREKAKRTDDLEARLAAMEKDATFAKALGNAAEEARVRDYFIPSYKGEMNPEAIRSAATEAGFLADPAVANQAPSGAALDAHNRIAAASSGAGTPAPTGLADAIATAKSAEEVMAIVESEQAAAAGLRSVRQNQ